MSTTHNRTNKHKNFTCTVLFSNELSVIWSGMPAHHKNKQTNKQTEHALCYSQMKYQPSGGVSLPGLARGGKAIPAR